MLTRLRMDVVCTSVAEAITHSGGLICDRALTGWDVGIFTLDDHFDPDHDLALRIVGASRTECIPPEPAADTLLRTVVVSQELYRNVEHVRRWIEEAMSQPLIEVLVWDCGHSASDIRRVEIPVTSATALFLDHALMTIGRGTERRTSESYCQLRTGRIRHAPQRLNVLTTVNGG